MESKIKLTVRIDPVLLQTVKTICFWSKDMTLQKFVHDALEEHLQKQPDLNKWQEAISRLNKQCP